ncbi:MAG: hypothetical protein IJ287_03165 [Methanobrevibacter sp.]|nr:hypothetical protein [Methanobrevibacter sp.]MBR1748879.1 hypothetical protein [Bacilli bacterium]
MQELVFNTPVYVQVKARISKAFTIENEEEKKILDEIIESKLDKMSYNTKGSLYYDGKKLRGFKHIIDAIISDLEEKGVKIN